MKELILEKNDILNKIQILEVKIKKLFKDFNKMWVGEAEWRLE